MEEEVSDRSLCQTGDKIQFTLETVESLSSSYTTSQSHSSFQKIERLPQKSTARSIRGTRQHKRKQTEDFGSSIIRQRDAKKRRTKLENSQFLNTKNGSEVLAVRMNTSILQETGGFTTRRTTIVTEVRTRRSQRSQARQHM